jgi:hypothetical protein
VAVYVDPLMRHGWIMYGRAIPSCHLFTDKVALEELHELAARIGLERRWFQDKQSAPHYDLTPRRRLAAIAAGAVEVDKHAAVEIWRMRRELVRHKSEGPEA